MNIMNSTGGVSVIKAVKSKIIKRDAQWEKTLRSYTSCTY